MGHQRKGRLYDPALRRFTTADPYVTEPLNPQGLNRYSYVQNNPMSFVDPSGFDECPPISYPTEGGDVTVTPSNCGESGNGGGQSGNGEPTNPQQQNQQSQTVNEQNSQNSQQSTQYYADQSQQTGIEQAQAQYIMTGDVTRAGDAAFTQPYTTPGLDTSTGLYFGLPMGPNWNGWLADNAGGDPRVCNGTFCSYDEDGKMHFKNLPFLPAPGDLVRAGIEAKDAIIAAWRLLFPSAEKAITFKGFGSEALLEQHFAKHAAEWGVEGMTKAEYLGRAQALLNSKAGGDILGLARAGGDILRYNATTNEFAVGTAQGVIRTFFRPTEGFAYWLSQVIR